MGNLSDPNKTFRPIIIHASSKDCSRDILVSPNMNLYQLHMYISRSFDVYTNLDQHSFTLPLDKGESIKTYYQIITQDQQQEGFVTSIAPGVYIEYSHPHEPLPLFSIDKKVDQTAAKDEIDMSFRLLRDERYICLDVMPFKFYYSLHHHNIELSLQPVNLPMHFYDDIHSSPKLIRKQGYLFGQQPNQHVSFKSGIRLDFIIQQQRRFYSIMDEYKIREACKKRIERLKKERHGFLTGQKRHSECQWVEPNGDRCVYCSFLWK